MSGRLDIVELSPGDAARIDEFVGLPFRLHREAPQWVPGFRAELRRFLERRHPFFEHSEARSFLARRGGRAVGRLTAFENRQHNAWHGRRSARFYHFETEADPESARRLFEAAAGWAAARGLAELVGPYGFSGFDGGGLLVEGHGHRAAMTMMGWNPPYYRELLEGLGFRKVMDFYSARLDRRTYRLPEKVRRVAEIALKRGGFHIPEFRSAGEVRRVAARVGRVFNEAFTSHPDFTPLTESEISRLADSLLQVTFPRLLKILFYRDEVAGFLFAFPDLSAALQRARGRLTPLAMADLLVEKRRARTIILNGAGILPRYQRLGGNAVLYHEIVRAVQDSHYDTGEMVQIAETTGLMIQDMKTLGGEVHKVHRVYRLPL